ncbi:MAG: AAA family ATPase, partial [Deltaproteobacteria bacterium]|nr:AAA family ATPase [Deltaproteobacteria bacterium]
MLELPSDGQTFSQIRENNLLYVDKTKFLYPIIKKPGCYFLSRPRRFGKSMLLDTLRELLKGKRDLFKDLWIDQSDYDFKPYPVITLSMAGLGHGEEKLEQDLINRLNVEAINHGLEPLDDFSPGGLLKRMVTTLNQKTKERVAILVDEYEAPIQEVINDLNLAQIHRQVLLTFYLSIKALADSNKTHLVYVTGETKFTQTSFFSGFNNLNDLTLNPNFNAACGFTLEEFETYFTLYLPDVLKFNQSEGFMSATASLEDQKKDIIDYYDGYCWDGENRILNPFSLIKMLDRKLLKPYWFETATPSFLMELLKHGVSEFEFPVNPTMTTYDLNSVDFLNLEANVLLFQTGYLTVDKMIKPDEYLLRRPNKEVSEAIDSNLLNFLLGQTRQTVNQLIERLQKALEKLDSISLGACFHDILVWNSHMALKASEGSGQAVILSVLQATHFNVVSEGIQAEGLINFLITTRKDTVFVCEFKSEKLEPKPKFPREKSKRLKYKDK